MLIDSDFHDYYDTALAHGIDRTCVYNRRLKKIDVPRAGDDKIHARDYRDAKERFFIRPYVIGFAGALYPMITIGPLLSTTHEDDLFFYDWKSVAQYLDDRVPEARKQQNKYRFHSFWHNLSDIWLQRFFDPATHARFESLFREHRVPIFLLVYSAGPDQYALLNPKLRNYSFMRVKDPYTAMQEIHMFLSGVLGGLDRDTAEVGNDDRIKQRGFDKWSFRKEPRKGKR